MTLCVRFVFTYRQKEGRRKTPHREMSPDSVLILSGARWWYAVCGGCQLFQGEKPKSQWEVHGANLKDQSAAKAMWVGCPHPLFGVQRKLEQRALAEDCGGQSRCGKRLGWEDVGTRKPVPAAQTCLHLLFSWVCAGLVGAALHSLPDTIVEESKTERCFSYSPCPEMAITDLLICFFQLFLVAYNFICMYFKYVNTCRYICNFKWNQAPTSVWVVTFSRLRLYSSLGWTLSWNLCPHPRFKRGTDHAHTACLTDGILPHRQALPG